MLELLLLGVALSPQSPLPPLPSLPPLTGALSALERLSFQADRERESFLRRAKHRVAGGDPLSQLSASQYALAPGSCVAITGASDGIGREAAVELAKAGYATVLCSRDRRKGEAAMQYVRARSSASARVALVDLDQSSFESVERGASAIREAAASLDAPLAGLLLNAGVWPTERRLTADGLEEGMQVCHVSHFQLTQQLLPDLLAATDGAVAEARVVTTSSSAHAFPADMDLSDLGWVERPWDATAAYGSSKLANLLFAQELAQRQPPSATQRLCSLAVHPGVVATSLFREFGAASLEGLAEQTPLGLVLKSPSDGCRPLVYALLAPRLPTGSYISDCELTDVSPAAKDASARAELWEWTENWLADARCRLEAAQAWDSEASGVADPEIQIAETGASTLGYEVEEANDEPVTEVIEEESDVERAVAETLEVHPKGL